MLRLASCSSTAIPYALGAIATSRILNGSVANAENHRLVKIIKRTPNFISNVSNGFSTVSSDALTQADHKLIRLLKSEIKSFHTSDIQVPEAPTGFPFEIEDNPGQLAIKLKREFEGEKIVVDVFNPIYPENYSEGDGDGGGADNKSTKQENPWCYPDEPRIQLTVNISKQNGENTMKIILWGTVGSVGYPKIFIGNQFLSPNELSFDWREFILVRGIDDSIPEFLMEYMNRRFDRHYLLHLKKFRQFVKE